jgi:hypothetical protein
MEKLGLDCLLPNEFALSTRWLHYLVLLFFKSFAYVVRGFR